MFSFFFFSDDLEEDQKPTEGPGRSDTDKKIIRQRGNKGTFDQLYLQI